MTFKPGQSGNPNGRKPGTPNKLTAEIKALAGKHTAAAIKELARLAQHAETEAARVAACKELLDRAVGKAVQAHGGADDAPPIVHEIKVTVVDPNHP